MYMYNMLFVISQHCIAYLVKISIKCIEFIQYVNEYRCQVLRQR